MTDAFWRRFLFPGALWLLLFFIVPFGIAVLISLGQNNDFGGVTYGWHTEQLRRRARPAVRAGARCARSATRPRPPRSAC